MSSSLIDNSLLMFHLPYSSCQNSYISYILVSLTSLEQSLRTIYLLHLRLQYALQIKHSSQLLSCAFLNIFTFLLKKFLATPCSMWDLSFPTKGWTFSPCIGRTVLTTQLPGKSLGCAFLFGWQVSAQASLPLQEVSVTANSRTFGVCSTHQAVSQLSLLLT